MMDENGDKCELNGKRYRWDFQDRGTPKGCWTWVDAERNMGAPQDIAPELNRLFVDACLCRGRLPDDTGELLPGDILLEMGATHEQLARGGFKCSPAPSGGGSYVTPGRPKVGPLKMMGYEADMDVNDRRAILRRAVLGSLPRPPDASDTYMAEWGDPTTKERICRIAKSLKSHSSEQKRHRDPARKAIEAWEADRAWLEREYPDAFVSQSFLIGAESAPDVSSTPPVPGASRPEPDGQEQAGC